VNSLVEPVLLANSRQSKAKDRYLDFDLPADLEAGEPPEARGLRRDQVRLMVSHYNSDTFIHTRFDKLTDYLTPGDVLVINTSALSSLRAGARADPKSNTPFGPATRDLDWEPPGEW
jgi:hypothetical protein